MQMTTRCLPGYRECDAEDEVSQSALSMSIPTELNARDED